MHEDLTCVLRSHPADGRPRRVTSDRLRDLGTLDRRQRHGSSGSSEALALVLHQSDPIPALSPPPTRVPVFPFHSLRPPHLPSRTAPPRASHSSNEHLIMWARSLPSRAHPSIHASTDCLHRHRTCTPQCASRACVSLPCRSYEMRARCAVHNVAVPRPTLRTRKARNLAVKAQVRETRWTIVRARTRVETRRDRRLTSCLVRTNDSHVVGSRKP